MAVFPLHIGIDGRNLLGVAGTGIATYAMTLARAVREMGAAAELLVAGDAAGRGRVRRYAAAFAAGMGGISSVVGPSGDETFRRARVAPDAFRCAQVHFDIWRRLLPVQGSELPDLMHWTAPLPLRLSGVPNIYTFHDVIPLTTDAGRYRRLLRTIAAHADHVVTVSEASGREILAALPELHGRLSVIPQAVEVPVSVRAMSHEALDAVVRGVVGCGVGEFYLFCGAVEPRKNLPALVRAFRASGSRRRLVLAGPEGAAFESLVGGPVVRVGYLEREVLLALMRGARALLYPSLDEGFGLPIIEAMGVGTAVLTSRLGATEEVAGDAALLVDPTELADLTAGIARLDCDDALVATLGRAGPERAERFAVRPYAARLSKLYGEVREAVDGVRRAHRPTK